MSLWVHYYFPHFYLLAAWRLMRKHHVGSGNPNGSRSCLSFYSKCSMKKIKQGVWKRWSKNTFWLNFVCTHIHACTKFEGKLSILLSSFTERWSSAQQDKFMSIVGPHSILSAFSTTFGPWVWFILSDPFISYAEIGKAMPFTPLPVVFRHLAARRGPIILHTSRLTII